MWFAILIQALMFVIIHAPELIATIRALFAFFKAHHNNPQLSDWMIQFSKVLTKCEETRDPKPLQDFLNRIRETIKGV